MEDIKKYAVKGHIPLVNEGIQEGRKLVYCKDCKFWEEESSGRTYCERTIYWTRMDADDFCSRGERRGEEEC